jgi:hypothetical protein
MVVYQSGSVSGVVALLGALKDFAVAQGATNNSYTTDGSGQRLHLKLGSGYFNFKALVGEFIPGGAASALWAITGYGSTGYNGSNAWYDQPGGPKFGSTTYPVSGLHGLGTSPTPSPTINYHLFYVDRPRSPKVITVTGATNASPIVITSNGHRLATGDRVAIASVGGNTAANGTWEVTKVNANTFSLNGSTGNGSYTSGGTVTLLAECIYLVIEYPAGQFSRMMFGQLDRSETGEVAGAWFLTSQNQYNQGNSPNPTLGFFGYGVKFGFNEGPRPAGMVYATVDALTGWKISRDNGNGSPANGQQFAIDNTRKFQNLVNCAPNAINSQTVGFPVGVFVTRDGTNQISSTTPWTLLGYLPELYFCNIRNLSPAGQFAVGSDNYRAFPAYQKSDDAFTLGNPFLTQHVGYFIRES